MSFLLKTENLTLRELSLEETLFHCANGYLGIRGNFDEGNPEGASTIRGAYINGFHDTHPIHHPEKLYGFPETGERILNITDVQSLEILVDGERLIPGVLSIQNYERELDMKKGLTTRRYLWTGKSGKGLVFEARRMASLEHPEYFLMSYRLTALDDLDLDLKSLVDGNVENFSDPDDPRVSGEGFKSLSVEKVSTGGGRIEMESSTRSSGFRLRVQADHRLRLGATGGEDELIESVEIPSPGSSNKPTSAALGWRVSLRPGETAHLEKRVRFRDSIRYPDGFGEKIPEEVPESFWFNDFAVEQKEYLHRFWTDADIRIEGDNHVLAGLRFSLYQLLQSGSRDSLSGIPAKGLSGEGYEGHYFWDTEIYMLPFFLHTRPELARQLLEYRYSTLPAAREQARILGHQRGAAYPWRTIAGRECSAYFPSGSAQYHINADIAHSVRLYLEATEDEDFLRDKGAELLFETARIWMEVGNFASDGCFHIHGVTGPDEYTCMVSDNYYTNRMARENLAFAAILWKRLSRDYPEDKARISEAIGLEEAEPGSWLKAAENMLIPFSEKLHLNPQDSSFLDKPEWDFQNRPGKGPLLLRYHHMTLSRYQVCKQADTILAHVLLGGEERDVLQNSFDYYEKRTTHDSSLSYAAFAIMAARLGDPEKALDYFRENASLDLDNSHGNTRDGIHAANMGGTWATFVQGFGGFFSSEGLPAFAPILPSSWKALGYRIRWKGSSIAVEAGPDKVELKLVSGPPREVRLYGKRFLLEDTLSANIPG